MFKWATKQFLYGRIYLWAKERLSGIFFTLIIIFLIFYLHSEYLKYVEFKEKTSENYIGLSFIIKNALILIVTFSYFYFYSFLNKAKKAIKKNEENIKQPNDGEMVDSLDNFLEDDEIDRKD